MPPLDLQSVLEEEPETSKHFCFDHHARISVLENKVEQTQEGLALLVNRTESLPAAIISITNLEKTTANLCEQLHDADQRLRKEELDGVQHTADIAKETISLKTKTDLLWYVIIIAILGTIIAKVIPVIFGV